MIWVVSQTKNSVKGILQKTSIEAQIEADRVTLSYRKRLKLSGLFILLIAMAGVGTYFFLLPKLPEWRQNRSLTEAEMYEKKGDYRRALLTLEQTIQLYPGSREAKRRLANFLE